MKRWRMRAPGWLGVLPALIALGVGLFLMGTALGNLEQGRDLQGKEQLEQSIRRAAVGCYAAEGVYPPDLAYLEERYGVQIDRSRYTVYYSVFAENLMPDITVLENGGQ